MNVHFSTHQLWQLWAREGMQPGDCLPARPVGWPPAERAYFAFYNEKGDSEILEVLAAPIVNGKIPPGAWTYDVKSGAVKIRELLLNLEIQRGWPFSDDVPALSQTTVEPEAAPITCPVCKLAPMSPIAHNQMLCYPPHNDSSDNDCPTSYQPLSVVAEGLEKLRPHGKYDGFDALEVLVPGTYGEALPLYPFLENYPGHEWDNRTTSQNAAWLIEKLAIKAKVLPQTPVIVEGTCVECRAIVGLLKGTQKLKAHSVGPKGGRRACVGQHTKPVELR